MADLRGAAAKKTLRAAGLMSGTSADGVDAAVVDIAPKDVEVLAFDTFAYPRALRDAVLRLCDAEQARVDELSAVNVALGERFASALIRLCRRARLPLDSIDVIGSHGQTVRHDPVGRRIGRRRVRSTLQIAEPSVIAERTGILTVADFRPRDLAAGGQGAPLVPCADFRLLAHDRLSRAVTNIGGIANVTYLPAGGTLDDVRAFDTGPGNMVIDRLVERVTDGRRHFDANGRLARKGRVNRRLLDELLDHPYFRRRPPKSAGREQFGAAFADRVYARGRRARVPREDLVATATALTAESIARALDRFLPGPVDELVLCGGGARNAALGEMLQQRVGPAKVMTTDRLGVSVEAKEAVAFALLAEATVRGRAGNVPTATGAVRPVVLGKIVPP